MRWLVVLLATTRIAVADGTQDLVVEYARIARDAAAAGHCDIVRDLGDRVKTADPAYHAASFVTDPAIATCIAPPPVGEQSPPISDRDRCLQRRGQLMREAQTRVDLKERGRLLQQLPDCDARPVRPRAEPTFVEPRPATPPVSSGRGIGQVIVGYLASTLGVIGGAYAGSAICVDDGGELGCVGSIAIGGYLGGTLTMSLAVYGAGSTADTKASLGATILGGMAGAGVGLVIVIASQSGGGGLVALTTPMIGSMIGFYSTRGWKDEPVVGSLLRLDRGRIAAGVPLPVRGVVHGQTTTMLPVLSGSF